MNIIRKTIITTVGKMSRPMMLNTYVTIGDLNKSFYKKNGKEALPIISEIAGRSGVEDAKNVKKMMKVKDMKDIAELFKMTSSMMGTGMEVIGSSDDKFHFKMPKCTYCLEGTSRELCEAMKNGEKMTISTLLGQEVKLDIVKTVAAGDKNCEVIFSIESKK
jgi:predicted hydrocarbon binding protein